ncbi:S-adenosyl-L-methionine-dependent methyltransferase [Catenaria anguillulae PL171]|uniref:thermospermine synthase n=1 Tax=Catenaria anguillulae PL171 TaxID=765915 RepID=A0A1Y2HYZ1_9FUNG|nr:S-adenosyl-L-methionine-dependent methyltransferase [Catenaria anguillulae PL171]
MSSSPVTFLPRSASPSRQPLLSSATTAADSAPSGHAAPTMPSRAPPQRRKSISHVLHYWNEKRTLLIVGALLVSSVLVNLFFASTIKPASFAISNAWSKRPGLVCDMDAISKEHLPTGKHHMVDMYGVNVDKIRFLEDSAMLPEVSDFIAKAGLTLLDYSAYHFDCGGITAVFLLSESHVSFHSWPEHGFVALDVYTCGKGKPEDIVNKFKAVLQPSAVRHTFLERGADAHLASTVNQGSFPLSAGTLRNETAIASPLTSASSQDAHADTAAAAAASVDSPTSPRSPLVGSSSSSSATSTDLDIVHHQVDAIEVMTSATTPPLPVDLCVNGDGDQDDCLLLRNVRIHADVQTPFQRIEIVDTQTLGRCMLLDRVVQFCEEDNHVYTANMVDPAMQAVLPAAVAEGRKVNVAIIGGGDGWVASHLLDQYADSVGDIRIVDIDAQVAQLTRAFFEPEGKHSSFTDARVQWTFDDAGKWLANLPADVSPGSADVVIIDCTDHTAEASKILYTKEFYANVQRLLRPGGRVVQQMNTVDEEYEVFMDEVRGQWKDAGLVGLREWTAYMHSFSGMSLFWLAQK